MSYISSINFKKSKDFQVFHNSSVRPDYAIGGELIFNHKGYEALKIKQKIIAEAIETYNKNKSKKAPSFKAKSYEWSAVCNIKPETTMQDLENLAKHFNEKYGFQCYQIAIHRDEGHIDDNGEKVINHHAHLEFITLDKSTGKSLFRAELQRPKALRQIQDEVAQILQMERGQDKRITKTQRIEPRKYAQMKEKERETLRQIQAQNNQTIKDLQNMQETQEATRKVIISKMLSDYDEALGIDTSQMKPARAMEAHKEQILSLKEQKARLEQERQAWKGQGYTAEDFKTLRALAEKGKSAEQLESQIKALREENATLRAQQNTIKEHFLSVFFEKEGIESPLARVVWAGRYDKGEFEKFFVDNQTLRESFKNASKIVEKQKNDINQLESEKMDLKANIERLKTENAIKQTQHKETAIERIQEQPIEAVKSIQRKPKDRGMSR